MVDLELDVRTPLHVENLQVGLRRTLGVHTHELLVLAGEVDRVDDGVVGQHQVRPPHLPRVEVDHVDVAPVRRFPRQRRVVPPQDQLAFQFRYFDDMVHVINVVHVEGDLNVIYFLL